MNTPRPLEDYVQHLDELVLEVIPGQNTSVFSATNDSRKVASGSLFVAVPGAKENGMKYISDAIASGASFIVAEEKPELPPGISFIHVSNAYLAAGRIAETAFDYPTKNMRLIGITGTNGKTTCACLLNHILESAGRKVGMIGTIEYTACGKTLTIADRTTPTPFELQHILKRMQEEGVEDIVMEVSSHALCQRRPGTMSFTAALFTNLTGDHLDYHHTMDEYFLAKKILFTEYLHPSGHAVINTDDPYGKRLYNEHSSKKTGFGEAPESEYIMAGPSVSVSCSSVTINGKAAPWSLTSPMIGNYNLYNTVGTALTAEKLGISRTIIQEAVAEFAGARGRLQRFASEDGITAFVDYAHTDDALRNVLSTLKHLKPEHLSVVFGCGGDRDRSKRPRMAQVAEELADRIYVTSDNPRSEEPEDIIEDIKAGMRFPQRAHCITDRRAAIITAISEAQSGDIVLIAGKGHEDYQDIKNRRLSFDDAIEVQHALNQRK